MNIRYDSRQRRAGFTLIEILVVIAIIAILASIVSVAATSVINAARRTKGANTATQIQTAIVNYYGEYGVYPLTSSQTSSTDVIDGNPATPTTLDPNEENLMWALCGNINAYTATTQTSTVSNARNIAFITPKKSDVDNNGVLVNPFSASGGPTYYYYNIAMDGDYDGILGDSGSVASQMPDFTAWTTGNAIQYLAHGLTQGVAVWACCDPKALGTPATSLAPNFWVHTY